MITKKKEWITTKELAEIKGIGDRAVRKYVQDNKYVVRKTSKSYESQCEELKRSWSLDVDHTHDEELMSEINDEFYNA